METVFSARYELNFHTMYNFDGYSSRNFTCTIAELLVTFEDILLTSGEAFRTQDINCK